MKKELKYLSLLGIVALIYLAFKLFSPKDIDWGITFHKEDKNPFGAYALNELLPGFFPGKEIMHSYKTIYELYDSLNEPVNFASFSTHFYPDSEDTRRLLKNIDAGGHAFIAAEDIFGSFADTLLLETDDYYYATDYSPYLSQDDTTHLALVAGPNKDNHIYRYPRNNIHNYLAKFDSSRATVIAVNDLNLPIAIKVSWGKGHLILTTTPMAFSNAYLLNEDNTIFAQTLLSYLPVDDLLLTEFYHLGRLEVSSPLRFILSDESLKWAYYLCLASLVLFLFFEAKRTQRIIPVIKPLANTSLEFTNTIGNLYFQHGDHKGIALKKIAYLLDHIRSTYWLPTTSLDRSFQTALAKRSGVDEKAIKELFALIAAIQQAPTISELELVDLNKKIEIFTQHKS